MQAHERGATSSPSCTPSLDGQLFPAGLVRGAHRCTSNGCMRGAADGPATLWEGPGSTLYNIYEEVANFAFRYGFNMKF